MFNCNISGIELSNCIMNASGCHCTTEEQLIDLFNSKCGCVISKSSTINSRSGNEEPRYYYDEYGSINAMGLPNFGYKFYTKYYNYNDKPYIQSIYPFNISEMSTMLNHINKDKYKRLVEVNISCPNLIGHSIDFESIESYLDQIKQSNFQYLNIGIKMAPIYQLNHFNVISNLLFKNDIKFITCCNSITNGLIIDTINETTCIHPKDGIGGIGGLYMKPTSLSNVYNFHKILNDKIDIIGCGGISKGKDIFDYILCGAKAVQIGTCLVQEGTKCFDRLLNEFEQIMYLKKYNNLNEFRGQIKVINPYNN